MNPKTWTEDQGSVLVMVAALVQKLGGSAVITQEDLTEVARARFTESWEAGKLVLTVERKVANS